MMDGDPPVLSSGSVQRASCTPFATILDLSDELLSNIFTDCRRGDDAHVLSFQLACRAFRQRALKIPILWTFLLLREDPRKSIERSGRCGLHIHIHCKVSHHILSSAENPVPLIHDDHLSEFLKLIKPHYAR